MKAESDRDHSFENGLEDIRFDSYDNFDKNGFKHKDSQSTVEEGGRH